MLLFILPFITFVRNVVEVRSTSILFPSFNIKASKYENHAIYRNRLRAVFGGKPVGYVGAGFREKNTSLYVSNSHLDTQWRWDVKATIDDYLYNTAVQNLALLEKLSALRVQFRRRRQVRMDQGVLSAPLRAHPGNS